MAGQQQLSSVITIGGNVDASFGSLAKALDKCGDTLLNLGNWINPVSQKVIGFGKESVNTFVDYDDMLRKIKATGELTDKELKAIDNATRQIGKTTKFSAIDASEAALLLTQVGLGYEEVISLLPDVLTMAQAGDLSIATSADYLYSTLKNMGIGIGDSDVLIDQMAKTASKGSTDMDTLGQSITRLGSGVGLIKGGSSEVLTILSAMSEFGEDMRGSQGGTQLRNFFLSLAAPAGNTKQVEAMLSSLGLSVEEYEEVMDGVDLKVAANAIKELGVEVYNESGELNDGIDIINSLRDSLAGLTDEQAKPILSQIFGKRTTTTAMNLIRLTREEWEELQASIEDSEGYASYMADVQEGGLGGALRLLESQISDLKIVVGDVLEEPIRQVAEGLGNIVTYLSGLDDATKENWVIAMGAIAAAGPVLLGLGGAMKFFAFIAANPVAAGVALTAIGLTAVAVAMQNIAEAEVAGKFGDMQLDMETLTPYVTSLTTEFTNAVTELGNYSGAVDKAAESYATASSTLSQDLTTALITGTTLTQADITNLATLGEQMLDATIMGITLKQTESSAFIDALFAGTGDEATKQNILDTQNAYFLGLYEDANAIGTTLREQMTEALRDGTLDANENEAIMATVGRMNEINAQIADMQNSIEYEKLLRKGQTTSLDSMREFTDMMTSQRDSELESATDVFETERAVTKKGYDKKIEAATTEDERDKLIQEQANVLATLDQAFERRKTEIKSQYAGGIARTWEHGLSTSDYGGMYGDLQGFVDQAMANEGMLEIGDWFGGNSLNDFYSLTEKLRESTDAMGGTEGFNNLIKLFSDSGMQAPAWLSTFGDQLNALRIAERVEANWGADIFGVPAEQMQAQGEALMALGVEDGANYPEGVGIGAQAGAEALYPVGVYATERLTAGGAAGMDAHSPSLIGIQQGMWYIMGLVNGTEQGRALLEAAGIEAGEVLTSGTETAFDRAWDFAAEVGKTEAGMFKSIMLNDLGYASDAGQAAAAAFGGAFSETMGLTTKDGITELQEMLVGSGYELPKFGVDGIVGKETTTALQKMLVDNGYSLDQFGIDGIMGSETRSAYDQMMKDWEMKYRGIPEVNTDTTPTVIAAQPAPTPATTTVTETVNKVTNEKANVNVGADASGAKKAIDGLNGNSTLVKLAGDDSLIRTLLSKGYESTVKLNYNNSGKPAEFAEGGRATEASIFGEAGAEWAIPEEHSDRTAKLLQSAAHASGFSWNELLDRTGGLSANPSNRPIQLVYAPTIHAQDATDVEDKLRQDKDRMKAWLAEDKMTGERMAYV